MAIKINVIVLKNDITSYVGNENIELNRFNAYLHSRIIKLASTVELSPEEVMKELNDRELIPETKTFTYYIKDETAYHKLRLIAKRNKTSVQKIIEKFIIFKKI